MSERKCNRRACGMDCRRPRAWWNTSTRAWYCEYCAKQINRYCAPEPECCHREDRLTPEMKQEVYDMTGERIDYQPTQEVT